MTVAGRHKAANIMEIIGWKGPKAAIQAIKPKTFAMQLIAGETVGDEIVRGSLPKLAKPPAAHCFQAPSILCYLMAAVAWILFFVPVTMPLSPRSVAPLSDANTLPGSRVLRRLHFRLLRRLGEAPA
jgi:hypothetical protein